MPNLINFFRKLDIHDKSYWSTDPQNKLAGQFYALLRTASVRLNPFCKLNPVSLFKTNGEIEQFDINEVTVNIPL